MKIVKGIGSGLF